jgi:hypothetical protein
LPQLIGPVNLLYKELKKRWPEVESWAKACHVQPAGLHGGEFNGNACRHLLRKKSLDKLETMLPQAHGMFLDALRAFDRVVGSCYGFVLSPSFSESISEFREIFLQLGMRVTPKIHIIVAHVVPFIEQTSIANDGKRSGLSVYSEQAFESGAVFTVETLINCMK